MYLEYWMIAVILAVFVYAMRDMYIMGYTRAYFEGGVFAHTFTMEIVKSVVTQDDLDRISVLLKQLKVNK